MRFSLIFFGLGYLFLVACNTGDGPAGAKKAVSDTARFYPLEGFFRAQVEYVDLRNFPLYRITVKDGKKDSVSIDKEEFIAWGNIFIDRSLRDPKQKVLYRETVFEDLSTGSYTLNYTATDPSAEVRNIDVLLDHETNQVKRIFIKSLYTRGDTTFEEQANWKADKSLQVNRTLQNGKGYTSTELNYINWNDK